MFSLKTLEAYLEKIILGLIFIIPSLSFLVFNDAIYPYVTSKFFVFRFLTVILSAFWLMLVLLNSKFKPQISMVIKSFLVFLAVFFLADLFGENFKNSFWSNYSRMEGFLSLIYFLIFVLVLSSVLNTSKRWNIYWSCHIVVSIGMTIIALLQANKIMYAVDFNRVDATFGNSSYLSIYASLIIFLCLFLFFTAQNKWLKYLLIFSIFFNVVSIYLSQTRSATLSLFLSVVFFFYLTIKNKKKVIAISLGGILVFVALVFALKNKTDFSTNIFERFSRISLQDESIQARVQIWSYCLRAFQEKPILGWGQENFPYLTKFYDPRLWSAPWVDRAHNIFLESMVSAGILGLLALVVFLFLLYRKLVGLKSQALLNPKQQAAILSFFGCWVLNQMFSIDFFTLSILFYSAFAYTEFLRRSKLQFKSVKLLDSNKNKIRRLSLIGILGAATFINYEFNVKSFITNQKIRKYITADYILKAEQQRPFQFGLEELLNQHNYFETDEIRSYLTQNAIFLLNQSLIHKKYYEALRYLYDRADSELQKQIKEDPDNLPRKFTAASFYTQFRFFDKAEMYYQELIGKVPQQQYFLIDYGNLKLTEGQMLEGLNYYKKAFELEPNFMQASMFLAMGYIYNRNFVEAQKIVDELIRQKRTEVFDEKLINAYVNTGRDKEVNRLLDLLKKYNEEKKQQM